MKTDRNKSERWSKLWGKPLSPEAERVPLGEEFIEGYRKHPGRRMTEEEFLAWVGEKTRAEWVDGEVILMSPVNRQHGRIQGWIYRLMAEYVDRLKLGEVWGTEFAVKLPGEKQRRIPDLFFVCTAHSKGVEETCFNGIPDLIMEVVSPDSTARDYQDKFEQYESAGVPEYWIVNPIAEAVAAFERVGKKYRSIEEGRGILRSKVLHGFFIKPAWLWFEPFPKLETALREMGVK